MLELLGAHRTQVHHLKQRRPFRRGDGMATGHVLGISEQLGCLCVGRGLDGSRTLRGGGQLAVRLRAAAARLQQPGERREERARQQHGLEHRLKVMVH